MSRGARALKWCAALALSLAASSAGDAAAFGDSTGVEIVSLELDYGAEVSEAITSRLAWELRKRTSVEPVLEPGRAKLEEPSLFRSPILYWRGTEEFAPLSDKAVQALRRYIHRGGFIIIDDASGGAGGFERSARRELLRAFPAHPLELIDPDHTVYRSFYLIDRPVGRLQGPDHLEGVFYGGRLAVVLSRHDLGGAFERDKLGSWTRAVVPGGEPQRERAIRLGVNLVLYALCTDYKDDQVHAPFIMRRQGRRP